MRRLDIPIRFGSVSQSERSSPLELLSQEAELGISDHLELGGGALALRSVSPPTTAGRLEVSWSSLLPQQPCPRPQSQLPCSRKRDPWEKEIPHPWRCLLRAATG